MRPETRMVQHARKRMQLWYHRRVIRHYLPHPADCLCRAVRRIPPLDDGADRLRVPLAELVAVRAAR